MENEERQNNNFTARELSYFLDKLEGIKSDSSLSTLEREIVDFLIKQTQKLLDNGEVRYNNIKNNIRESSIKEKNQDFSNFNSKNRRIKNSLKDKVGRFIIVYIKTGGKNCKMKGILSNVHQDFIILINNSNLFEIKIKEIAAIKIRVSSGERCGGGKEKIKYKDQYYLNENEFCDDSPEPESERIKTCIEDKEQKNYNIKREQKDYSASDKGE